MSIWGRAYGAFDGYQRRHAWLGFPLAVRQKYGDDQGGFLAATIAYYGFFAILPLLLVFVTLLGFALRGNVDLQNRVLGSALAEFPVVGDQLKTNVHALSGNGLALGIGIGGALWAGMGFALAVENAMNHIWGVPFSRRPDPLRARLRALGLLLLLGGASVASTVLGGVATVGARYGLAVKLAGVGASLVVNFLVFWITFGVATSHRPRWRALLPGAVAGALAWEGLQNVGGYYVGHELRHASTLYGFFAIVIGLMSWVYVGAILTLLCAEANVVASRRLWPRSFSVVHEQPLTEGDENALRQRAEIEERRQDEDVEVQFDGDGDPGTRDPAAADDG